MAEPSASTTASTPPPATPAAVTAEEVPAALEPRVMAQHLLDEARERLTDALAALEGQADPQQAAGLVGQASTLTGRALYFLRQMRG
jgi:hypothetical protein